MSSIAALFTRRNSCGSRVSSANSNGVDGGGPQQHQQQQPSSSGLRILMKGLSYHVPSNKQRGARAYLLNSVSAFLEPGQMTALMGPSGSGKTTLLDLLAGRKTVGKTEGHLSFGGLQPTRQFLRRYTGYVEQFDTLLGDLTVREMLLYTAELKRPINEPLEDKRREVETLLRRLALDTCADVRIGDPMSKGISGGQAKRTNIGIALISNPRVLFLDEPTSGLDSHTANEVMKVVAGLLTATATTTSAGAVKGGAGGGGGGTTIAATIHSPTAATFALFDRVMLLVRGQLVYFGPQGLPALTFAATQWPSAAGAVDILELHRAAAAATTTATAAASASNAANRGVSGVSGDGNNAVQQQQQGGDGAATPLAVISLPGAEPGPGPGRKGAISALAFNDAEVLMETVTEADQLGEADALAAIYNTSALRQENDRQLELYLAEAGVTFAPLPPSSERCAPCCGRMMAMFQVGGGKGNDGVDDLEAAAAGPSPRVAPQQQQQQQQSSLTAWINPAVRPSGPSRAASSVPDQIARELATRSETVTPWYWGLRTLIKYRTSHNFRNPAWVAARTADKLLISLIILTLYLGVGDDLSPTNLINVQSALFMWALLPAFGAMSYVPAIVLERRLFVRERSDGLYAAFTYLAFKLAEELVLSLVVTLVFSSYVFYGLQLQGSWIIFWLVYFVDLSVGVAMAYLVAALSPNMDIANMALPGFVVTLLFFAGQLMTLDSIPAWWQWYSRIDFLRYAWGALMLNQFEDNNVEFAGGVSILRYYGQEGGDKWAYMGYLAIFWVVFVALGLAALSWVRHQKR